MALNTSRFQFISDALNSSGGFATGDYLVQYPRESGDKFKKRKEVAWYENKLKPACERFAGFLAARPPIRNANDNPLIEAFFRDADGRNNSIDLVMSSLLLNAKARGCMLAVIDAPNEVPANAGEQIERRLVPNIIPVLPEKVAKYRIDKNGDFVYLEINSTHYIESEDKDIDVIRRWDKNGWQIRDLKENIIASGEYNIGICPVVAFTESGEFGSEGEFSQIADLSKRLYNSHSELDEILRSQTFSLLTYEVPADQFGAFDAKKAAEVATIISTNNMLIYAGKQPGFIAPSDGPASIYMERIEKIEHRIDLITHNPVSQSSNQNQSGYALSLKFQSLNSSLTKFARRAEDFERRVMNIVARWLSSENRAEVNYPSDYQLADLGKAIEVLQNMIDSGAPTEYVDEKLKQIIAMDLTGTEKETLDTIIEAIGNGSHEREEGEE